MKVYPDQLQTNFSKAIPAACWLSGDEPLQMRDCCDLIRRISREQGFTERVQHDVDANFDWGQLLVEGNNMSLFSDKKVIELNLKSSKLDDAARKALLEYLQNASPDNLLLLLSPRIESASTKTQWFSKLEAHMVLVQVYSVDSDKLPAWISQRMKNRKLTADVDAVQLLADRIEGNMLAADQEIEKLSLLFGPGTHLRNEHITRSVADSARYNVFGLIDACLAGESTRVIKTLQGLQQEGQQVLMLNAMLSKELRQLGAMKNEIVRGAKLDDVIQRHHVWKNRQAATRLALQRLTASRLANLLAQTRHVDLAVKGMQLTPPWLVMDKLCLEFSR
jgi:DNA polymerase-3 subunit delta